MTLARMKAEDTQALCRSFAVGMRRARSCVRHGDVEDNEIMAFSERDLQEITALAKAPWPSYTTSAATV